MKRRPNHRRTRPPTYRRKLKLHELQPDDIALIVIISQQRLYLMKNGGTLKTCPISTSRYGIGNRKDSNKTPLGVHRICEKIGGGCPVGAIFKARRFTGQVWDGGTTNNDMILTRILRLEGLEEGINRGGPADTFTRLIYVHGTNHEDAIGAPASHGCIRMMSEDVVDLFERVDVGTLVDVRR